MRSVTFVITWFAVVGLIAARAADAPRTFLLSAPALVAAKASLDRGEPGLQPALVALRAEADRALARPARSVMDKTTTASTGDKHDYFSYGPYWWPDPAKPNGLPYIRRDGEINPAARQGCDDQEFSRLTTAVDTLSLAYWFTRDERYAEQAAKLARVWFLEPATRMNPNLEHAQAIPGINDGRGIGIIESRRLATIAESLSLLAGSRAWASADQEAFRTWLAAFYSWLTTSKNGRDEHGELNNHGSWYDFQSAHLALQLDRRDDAKKILTEGLTLRLASQVQPDGSQPRELARTKSFDYSLFNLEALFGCAQLARHVGVDWWSFATPDGRSLRAALNYVAPYMDPHLEWPKKDLHDADRTRLVPLVDLMLQHGEDASLRRVYEKFSDTSGADARWRLTENRPFARAAARPAGP